MKGLRDPKRENRNRPNEPFGDLRFIEVEVGLVIEISTKYF